MAKESVLIIRCFPWVGPPSVWHEHFPLTSSVDNIEWMLGILDAALARAFEHAPPIIGHVQVSFLLGRASPRPIVAKAFYDAALALSQIVRIMPDDAQALARNPFDHAQQGDPVDDRSCAPTEPESTGKRRTGGGKRHV